MPFAGLLRRALNTGRGRGHGLMPPPAFPGRHPAQPLLQTGTFRLCFTRFSVKLVLIDWTFGSSTIAFFTVAS